MYTKPSPSTVTVIDIFRGSRPGTRLLVLSCGHRQEEAESNFARLTGQRITCATCQSETQPATQAGGQS